MFRLMFGQASKDITLFSKATHDTPVKVLLNREQLYLKKISLT